MKNNEGERSVAEIPERKKIRKEKKYAKYGYYNVMQIFSSIDSKFEIEKQK